MGSGVEGVASLVGVWGQRPRRGSTCPFRSWGQRPSWGFRGNAPNGDQPARLGHGGRGGSAPERIFDFHVCMYEIVYLIECMSGSVGMLGLMEWYE